MPNNPSKPSTKKSALARRHPDVVRIPRSLARVTMPIVTEPKVVNGTVVVETKVRAETVLRAIAALGRRHNTDRQMVWGNREMSARVGVTADKAGAGAVAQLHEVGIIESYTRKSAGTPYTVTLAKVDDEDSLQLPLAACWKHKWVQGNVTGPRYGKATAIVARVLLAIIATGDWSKPDYLTVKWKRSNKFMTKHLGLGKGTWEDWWKVFMEETEGDAWIQVEETFDPWGGYGPYCVTINWALLPALADAPALSGKTTPVAEVADATQDESGALSPDRGESVSPDGGGSTSPDRVGHFHPELKEDSAFKTVPSKTVPSPHPAADADDAPEPTARKGGGKEKKIEAEVEDIRVMDVVRNGLKSSHAQPPVKATATDDEAAGDQQTPPKYDSMLDEWLATTRQHDDTAQAPEYDNGNVDYGDWLLVVVAVLSDANTPNRLGLNASHVRALSGLLRPCYDAGWTARKLGTALTANWSPPSVGMAGALKFRVGQLPAQPNYVAVPVSNAEARRKAEEERVYALGASSRSADKYYCREM